jgi:hypothetical protein
MVYKGEFFMKSKYYFKLFFTITCIMALLFVFQLNSFADSKKSESIKGKTVLRITIEPVEEVPETITEIIFILDRSGSMEHLVEDTIGGFNSFVKKQSKLGETLLTTILFDDKYEILHDGVEAEDVVLTEKEYYTRGSTALLDAIGKTIVDVNYRITSLEDDGIDRDVIFVITTDGLENSSTEYTYEDINKMITVQKEKHDWSFIFLGANIDVAKESKKLNIDPGFSFGFIADSAGTRSMFGKAYEAVNNARIQQGQNLHIYTK